MVLQVGDITGQVWQVKTRSSSSTTTAVVVYDGDQANLGDVGSSASAAGLTSKHAYQRDQVCETAPIVVLCCHFIPEQRYNLWNWVCRKITFCEALSFVAFK